MENYYDSDMEDEKVQLTYKMKAYLTETAKWAKFLSIVGFVMLGLLFLCFMGLAISSSLLGELFPDIGMLGAGPALFVFLFVFAFYGTLIFIPSWYMFGFASKTLKSIPTMNTRGMESALENLKSLYKFYGIFLLVILSFYAICLVIGLGATFVAYKSGAF